MTSNKSKGPTPERLASTGTEDGNQLALFCWASKNFDLYPQLKRMFHIPNGGSRNMIEAVKLKGMGIKAGIPDIFLPYKNQIFIGLWIELKVNKNKTSSEQDDWIAYMRDQGYCVGICYGWEEARDLIVKYLEIPECLL